jgi:hypothetical protein
MRARAIYLRMGVSPKEMSNREARPTRSTWHTHGRLKIGPTAFLFGGVPPNCKQRSPVPHPQNSAITSTSVCARQVSVVLAFSASRKDNHPGSLRDGILCGWIVEPGQQCWLRLIPESSRERSQIPDNQSSHSESEIASEGTDAQPRRQSNRVSFLARARRLRRRAAGRARAARRPGPRAGAPAFS